jgi:hypothetical protein
VRKRRKRRRKRKERVEAAILSVDSASNSEKSRMENTGCITRKVDERSRYYCPRSLPPVLKNSPDKFSQRIR